LDALLRITEDAAFDREQDAMSRRELSQGGGQARMGMVEVVGVAATARTKEILVSCSTEAVDDIEPTSTDELGRRPGEGHDAQRLPATGNAQGLDRDSGFRCRRLSRVRSRRIPLRRMPRDDRDLIAHASELVGNMPRYILDSAAVLDEAFDHDGDAQWGRPQAESRGYRLDPVSASGFGPVRGMGWGMGLGHEAGHGPSDESRRPSSHPSWHWHPKPSFVDFRSCVEQISGNRSRHRCLRAHKFNRWNFNSLMSESRGDKAGPGLDKRRLILDSAIKVFAAKGYHGTRISDIARDAEIAYGLVYHYFKNKEEILDSIFREHWGGFIELVRDVAEDDRDVRAKLLSVAAITLSAYRKRPEWVKVLVFEIQRTQRFADPERLRMAGQLFGLITRILREGQDRGELRKELDPTLASYIFVGGLDIVVTNRVLDLRKIEGDEGTYYARIARTVVDLFLNGMVVPVADSGN
jgi:TetR/AcrR family fatty acid metabolism transcriptional regulator